MNADYEKIVLWKNVSDDICLWRRKHNGTADRPAMLVVPGGGYGCVCMDTEGEPVAERFAELGFQVFILNYRVAPNRYPLPQQDLLRAVKVIRAHAAPWHVHKNNIAVCGFSAGGHLCACAGTLASEIEANDGDAADRENARPDAMLLAYPVITFTEAGHLGSGRNLLDEQFNSKRLELSLETRVTKDTPPVYLWHTVEDQLVPVENSLLFSEAMRKNHRPYELHVFPRGPHGMQLGYGREDIARWPEEAKAFLHGTCGFRFPGKEAKRTVVLTFDDACKSHLEVVAPILKKYGFGATFFICRFKDEWRTKNEKHLLAAPEVKQLHDMGFEIGNHTWNHPDLRKLSISEAESEIDRLDQFLLDAGVPRPVSFAYPGGPYAENAAPVIEKKGFAVARTTEQHAWDKTSDPPMRVPSFPIQGDNVLAFYHATGLAKEDNAVVLVFHGVPDPVHDWVNMPPELFEKYMEYLYYNDFRVVGMNTYRSEP